MISGNDINNMGGGDISVVFIHKAEDYASVQVYHVSFVSVL